MRKASKGHKRRRQDTRSTCPACQRQGSLLTKSGTRNTYICQSCGWTSKPARVRL